MKYDEEEHHESICRSVSFLSAGNSGAGHERGCESKTETEQEEDHDQSR